MAKDKYIKFYEDWYFAIKNLPSGSRGDACMALIEYAIEGRTLGLKPQAEAVVLMAKSRIDQAKAEQKRLSEVRRNVANKRWKQDDVECKPMQTDANACKCMQMHTNNKDISNSNELSISFEKKSVINNTPKRKSHSDAICDNPVNSAVEKREKIAPKREKPTEATVTTPEVVPVLDPSFDKFWDLYGKKIDRKKCQMRWRQLSSLDKERILEQLPAYTAANPDIRYRKNPLTYLNGECWNDEIFNNKNRNHYANSNKNDYRNMSDEERIALCVGAAMEGYARASTNQPWE